MKKVLLRHDRTERAGRPSRVAELGERNVVHVGEVVVREHRARRFHEVALAVKLIRARLEHEVRDAPFGVAERRVERGRLHPELLDQPLRRYVSRGDLAGIGRRRARDAVDRDVAAVGAGPVHRVADDVRRLEGPVEPGRPQERRAGRQADERVRVAMGNRQLRHAPGVDHLSQGSRRGLEQRRRRADRDFLRRRADLEAEFERQPIGDANFNPLTHKLLEAREFDGDPVRTWDQVRRLKEPLLVRDDGHVRAHRDICHRHRRAGDDTLAGVEDRAGDRAASFLRRRRHRESQRHGDQEHGRKQLSDSHWFHA